MARKINLAIDDIIYVTDDYMSKYFTYRRDADWEDRFDAKLEKAGRNGVITYDAAVDVLKRTRIPKSIGGLVTRRYIEAELAEMAGGMAELLDGLVK